MVAIERILTFLIYQNGLLIECMGRRTYSGIQADAIVD